MSDQNQYQTPSSHVDAQSGESYSEVKVFSAQGRMGRVRFINYYLLIPFAIMMGLMAIMGIFGAIMGTMLGDPAGGFSIIGGIMTLVMLIIYVVYIVYSFMVIIQRCHDFNASGWLSLLMLIPAVGLFFLIALLVIPGTEGENKFGAPTRPNSTVGVVFASLSPVILIVVIGILAAISIPAYQEYMEQVQQQQQFEQSQ